MASARGGAGSARSLAGSRPARDADTEDAGVSEITDEVVRLVTMHASKGLEYPIVALANLGSRGATRIEPVADARAADSSSGSLLVATSSRHPALKLPGQRRSAARRRGASPALRGCDAGADRLIIPVSKREKDKTPKLDALAPSLPGPEDPLEAPDRGRVRLDPTLSPEPLSDEPEPSSPDVAAVSAALAERDAWIAADESTRSTARRSSVYSPRLATRVRSTFQP